MTRRLASIEYFLHSLEKSIDRPSNLIFLTKAACVQKRKANITQQVLLPPTWGVNIDDVKVMFCEIQIVERGKRKARIGSLMRMLPIPVLHRYVTVPVVTQVIHISCMTSDWVWISDADYLILTNMEGKLMHYLIRKCVHYGAHSVNSNNDLIYIDNEDNIKKLSKDNKTESILIEKTEQCTPSCVYCSPCNGDLFVGMVVMEKGRSILFNANVVRYNSNGQHIQTIRDYTDPAYITENRNGDIIVSDVKMGVVVSNCYGKHRFVYTGPELGPTLSQYGICTDAMSNILICDNNTHTVQMIDKDGISFH
ncbi:uncharacterized protein LOC134240358 [Saccostrea cucullata]|uniref:uncharacterized protein LOC134240358 n=1 Tax=Saccostrea cuccullata TaxID=36930 RepID=UPI002ED38E3B